MSESLLSNGERRSFVVPGLKTFLPDRKNSFVGGLAENSVQNMNSTAVSGNSRLGGSFSVPDLNRNNSIDREPKTEPIKIRLKKKDTEMELKLQKKEKKEAIK